MVMDGHRKYDVPMCYECGYMVGRNLGEDLQANYVTNYEKLREMNFNETVAFLSNGLGIAEDTVAAWLDAGIA